MDITKMKKWLNDHREELKICLKVMNANHPLSHIDPKMAMQYRTDRLERFIDELTVNELRKIIKGRDWYYLVEWQETRRKVKEELFL